MGQVSLTDPALQSALFGGLVLVAVSAGIWAGASGRAATAQRHRARLARFAPPARGTRPGRGGAEAEVHRHASEILARRRNADRLSFRALLDRAGLAWPAWTVPAACLGLAALAGGLALSGGMAPLPAGLIGAGLGPGIFLLAVRLRQARRLKAMEKTFPAALDIIVRGVKSGLPLIDCLRIVSREIAGPLGAEFGRMIDQQSHGVSLSDAVNRMASRVPLSEVNFFAIVVGLQSRTGGRLSESLDNLVSVLRARTQLRAKVKSMSAEAKASGGIIGSLPLVVTTLVYITSPQYIGLLFSEPIGNVVLAGSAVWMLAGVLVMAKMIRIEV